MKADQTLARATTYARWSLKAAKAGKIDKARAYRDRACALLREAGCNQEADQIERAGKAIDERARQIAETAA